MDRVLLCIDDEEIGLRVRQLMLQRIGYSVLVAKDGETGLVIFDNENVDLAVVDYSMPGMDGGMVVREMRQRKPQVPIIMLSAYVHLPDDVEPYIDGHIVKGSGANALLDRVQSMLPL